MNMSLFNQTTSNHSIDAIRFFDRILTSMVGTSVFFILIFLSNLLNIRSLNHPNSSNDLNSRLRLNTSSGIFHGKEVSIHNVSIRQFFGIPYGEKPIRFQMPLLRQYNKTITYATKRTSACIQASGGLSYGPFDLPDMYDEDCLTLDMFIPSTKSIKAIMVFCHGGSNQVGSGSLFDGSAVATIGDVIVITINYRLNILGFLTPDTNILKGNYGLHDQILALKWISINAKNFRGNPKQITYVGHSAGAANAILLAMSKRSDGLIARVIAQSGCPLNQWAIDRNPKIRFDNVIERNGMKTKNKFIESNINQFKTLSPRNFRYKYYFGLDVLPDYPFPVIDGDILTANLEEMIHTGPLINVDLLIGVTADESLYFAEEHIFNYYLPKKYRRKSSSTRKNLEESIEHDQSYGFRFFKKNQYIKNYLQTNYPNYLCFYNEIQARYMPDIKHQHNLTEIARRYTNLISDLMFYYDLVRFLRERLNSEASASTYVYYYTNPPIFNFENVLRRIPDMVGHFAELDLIWGVPFFNRSNVNIPSRMNLSYTPKEIELSYQMIRYWTNFAKTGNPNDPANLSYHWPLYEVTNKSYINFHAEKIRVEEQFLEDRFQFWEMILHRQICPPFRWYHTTLLVGILVLTILLITIYIFYNNKRSRRNIIPTELTNSHVITTYHFLPSVPT